MSNDIKKEKEDKPKKETKSKTITIRMRPSVHDALMKKAKDKKISLSKFMTEASIQNLDS